MAKHCVCANTHLTLIIYTKYAQIPHSANVNNKPHACEMVYDGSGEKHMSVQFVFFIEG